MKLVVWVTLAACIINLLVSVIAKHTSKHTAIIGWAVASLLAVGHVLRYY